MTDNKTPNERRPSDLAMVSYYIALAAVTIAILGGFVMIGGMHNG